MPHRFAPRAQHNRAFEAEIASSVRCALGNGNALDSHTRGRLERALRADFSAVRVHVDGESDRLARALDADAFTVGADVFFRSGRYAPGTRGGLGLLAHEAAHVLQQARAAPRGSNGEVRICDVADPSERLADQVATRVLRGHVPSPAAQTSARRLTDSEPLLIQRHASWEHRLLGDQPTADLVTIADKRDHQQRQSVLSKLSAFLDMWATDPSSVTPTMIQQYYPYIRTLQLGSVLVTYGELNTLPDYVANLDVLNALTPNQLQKILQAVRQEGYDRVQRLLGTDPRIKFADAVGLNESWDFIDLLLETRALDNLTADLGPDHTNHYTANVGRNACHFAPYSWYRWLLFAQQARNWALQAYNTSDPTAKNQYTFNAWVNNGFADHFLQDSFAAGHLVNKTLIMQWFVEWAAGKWYVPVADWQRVKHMTLLNQPDVAAFGLYSWSNPGSIRDPQTVEEQPTEAARIVMCGVVQGNRPNLEDSYQDYLAFLNSTVIQSACGALHDYYNERSLWVASNACTTPFQIWGDNTMLKGGDSVKIASTTSHSSQQAIQDILTTGQTGTSIDALFSQFPTVVRGANNQMLPLLHWNASVRSQAFKLFPDVHYWALRLIPRIKHISIDQRAALAAELDELATKVAVSGS
jgi:hypothetical protein